MDCLFHTSVGGITAEVFSQDSNHVTVQCTFYDGLSHYCLLCCSTDPSVQVSAYSNVSSSSGSIANVSLYGLKPGAVYYCKASATDDVTTACATPKGLLFCLCCEVIFKGQELLNETYNTDIYFSLFGAIKF